MPFTVKKTAPKKTVKGEPALYRGVRIQPVGGQSNFSRDQIRKAVETAIAKNANALAQGG